MISKYYIKKRQEWVKDNPARSEKELARLGYVHDAPYGQGHLRTILSIDLFSDPLAWRCQVAIFLQPQLIKAVKFWTIQERAEVLGIAAAYLDGVGVEQSKFVTFDSWTVELAYPCTVEEAAYVAKASIRPPTNFAPLLVGEFAEYDVSNSKTKVGDQSYMPSDRRLIYARDN